MRVLITGEAKPIRLHLAEKIVDARVLNNLLQAKEPKIILQRCAIINEDYNHG